MSGQARGIRSGSDPRHGGCGLCRSHRWSGSPPGRPRSSHRGLGQLHHNEAAVATVLRVEAHHRVGGGGGAGEEVQAYEILPRNRADQGPQQVHGLWVVKQFPAAEQLPQLRVSVGDVGNDVLEQRPAEVPDLGVDLIPTGRCGEHDQIIWLVRNLLPGPPPGMVLVHAVPICMGRQLEPPGRLSPMAPVEISWVWG